MLRVIEGWTVPWIGMQRNCYCLNLCCRGITSRWWMRVITKLLESWHGSRFMNWGDVEWSELEWVEAQLDNISQNQFGFSYEMFTFLVVLQSRIFAYSQWWLSSIDSSGHVCVWFGLGVRVSVCAGCGCGCGMSTWCSLFTGHLRVFFPAAWQSRIGWPAAHRLPARSLRQVDLVLETVSNN